MGLWTYKRLQPALSSVSGHTKSKPKRAVASVCPFALLERLQCNTNGPIVRAAQLQSASIMAEALDVDALDTDLDEYIFLRVCGKLGYVIHPLEGQLPGTFLVAKNFAGTKSHRCEATHERAARDVLGSVTGRRCYSDIAEYIRRTPKRLLYQIQSY